MYRWFRETDTLDKYIKHTYKVYKDRRIFYLGKCEDGNFYHIVVFKYTLHVYVRRKVSNGRRTRWITEKVKEFKTLPKKVKFYIRELKNSLIKDGFVIVIRDARKYRSMFETLYNIVEAIPKLIESIKKGEYEEEGLKKEHADIIKSYFDVVADETIIIERDEAKRFLFRRYATLKDLVRKLWTSIRTIDLHICDAESVYWSILFLYKVKKKFLEVIYRSSDEERKRIYWKFWNLLARELDIGYKGKDVMDFIQSAIDEFLKVFPECYQKLL